MTLVVPIDESVSLAEITISRTFLSAMSVSVSVFLRSIIISSLELMVCVNKAPSSIFCVKREKEENKKKGHC